LSGEIDERSKNRKAAETKTSLEETANPNGGSLENDEDKKTTGNYNFYDF
jgi:hypothetical protein